MNVLRRVRRALGARLWRRFNKAHPVTGVAPVITEKQARKQLDEAGKIAWERVLAALKGLDDEPARVEYKLPERLPGVRPAAPPEGQALKLGRYPRY